MASGKIAKEVDGDLELIISRRNWRGVARRRGIDVLQQKIRDLLGAARHHSRENAQHTQRFSHGQNDDGRNGQKSQCKRRNAKGDTQEARRLREQAAEVRYW